MIDTHRLLHELHEATEIMRAHQRRFHAARPNTNARHNALQASMVAERKVDSLLAQLRVPAEPGQPELGL